MNAVKNFVGLDLSYSGTGMVVLTDGVAVCGQFKAGKPEHPFVERANDLCKQILRLLPNPKETFIVIEGAAHGAEFNVFMLGELTGAVKLCLYLNGYKFDIVPPTVLKKYATGSGAAQKPFVAAHVAQKWGFTNSSNDIVDAYVLAKIAEVGIANLNLAPTKKVKKTTKART